MRLKILILTFVFGWIGLFAENCEKKEKEAPEKKEEKEDSEKKEKKEKEEEKEAPEKKEKADTEENEKREEKPPPIGNYSMPTSQQPGPLFGFGGNIIDKDEVQIFFFADDLSGPKKRTVDLIPNVVFGVTDYFSVNFLFPFTPEIRDGCHRSSGFEDFGVQFEYAFYNKSTYCYQDQATLVFNVTAPTGSIHKTPPTGFGAPTFFIGGTYNRMWVDWFLFLAEGVILTTSDRRTKVGDQFFYQFMFGRSCLSNPPGWLFAWMLEVDGQYNKKSRVRGEIDPNSGGNTIWVTPSLWASTNEFLFQFGVSFPVNQNLFGEQRKFDYVLNLNIAWSFY